MWVFAVRLASSAASSQLYVPLGARRCSASDVVYSWTAAFELIRIVRPVRSTLLFELWENWQALDTQLLQHGLHLRAPDALVRKDMPWDGLPITKPAILQGRGTSWHRDSVACRSSNYHSCQFEPSTRRFQKFSLKDRLDSSQTLRRVVAHHLDTSDLEH